MTPFKIAATFATLLLVAGCTAANAEDATTKATAPTYGPGWRHEQMMQARAQGQIPQAMMARRGAGYGFGMGYGMGRNGPPLNADGTIDTAKLPEWCPMKASLQQTQ